MISYLSVYIIHSRSKIVKVSKRRILWDIPTHNLSHPIRFKFLTLSYLYVDNHTFIVPYFLISKTVIAPFPNMASIISVYIAVIALGR